MPEKTKEQKNIENKDKKATTSKAKTSTTKKATKSTTTKKVAKNATKKTTKTTTSKKVAKSTTKKPTKSSTVKKVAKTSTTKKKKIEAVEYYDLPYRYNKTIIKLLAQTPTTLFVYWEISDEDIESFKKEYGYDFFHKTHPVLIVHNDTMNYSFEVDINDFANCWYIHVNDSNCDYRIELGRRPIFNYHSVTTFNKEEIEKYPSKPINTNYLYVTTSNELKSPNDKVLNINNSNNIIQIRNIKTNNEFSKKIEKNNKNKIYEKIYKTEFIEDILSNPSSM